MNDISFSNARVLAEYTVNGSMGESLTGYSYGVWRESYSVTKGGGITGNYYYTRTGSVANFVSGSGITGYAYRTDGSRSFYGAESAVLYTSTQAAGYGYNGEYTHESLGIQYLRARYLNMATGTFLSRDTYGGTIDNILNQNRYTYVGNNPVNYSDPDGHKAVGTIVKSAFSAVASTIKSATRQAQNHTSRVTATGAANSGNSTAAVLITANRITRNGVNGAKQGTTKGTTSITAGIVSKASADEINRAAQERAARAQTKADFVSMPLDAINSAGAWFDKGFTNLAGYIDVSWAGERVGKAAGW